MKKWLIKIGLLIIVLVIGHLFAKWYFKEAFGPNSKNVTLKLPDNKVLFCTETYNADIHSVIYNVDFKLIEDSGDTLHLGQGSYGDTTWKNEVQLKRIGNFYVLSVKDYSYSKFLLTTLDSSRNTDTILSPQNLRDDSIWKSQTGDIPAWVYTGSSHLDSIKQNKFFVSYEYRIGDYKPWKFYIQTVEHEFDTISGKFRTMKIFDRLQK